MSRPKRLRVCCPKKSDWGLGHVLADDGGAKVTVFFLAGGKLTLNTTITELDLVTGEAARNPILDIAAQANWELADRNLYVIELRPEIFTQQETFLETNLHYIPGTKPCVYVGLTGHAPEERFREHLRGNHSARFVRRYGVRLLAELYGHFNPMPYALGQAMEPELARQLREQGYGVWQN